MNKNVEKILTLDSLEIGYSSGKYKKILLPPLNASADKGELIAVIGRNGIGKSTLLRTLVGLQDPIGGNILYSGKKIKEHSRIDLAQKVGYISTEILKVSNMSVYDLVSLGRFPHTNWIGKIDQGNHIAIMDAIRKTSMMTFCDRYISELSDGERQRAMIARILAQDTRIMIMDEPTAFLDIGSKYEILHLLHILSQKNEKTIIFSTHDLHVAISQADKIWLILDDKLIEGAPEDLMIEGAFGSLFDSSVVKFDSELGTLSFRTNDIGSIYIAGEGIMRHWTEKAVSRTGFSVSGLKTDPFIIVPSGSNSRWQLVANSSTLEFGSIYELISCLSKDYIRPT
jgi:iron complex transport system ATP-binding protein